MPRKIFRSLVAPAEGLAAIAAREQEFKQKTEPHPLAYRVEDVAKVLGLSRTFIFELIKDGRLKSIKVGKRRIIPVKEVEAFLSGLGGAA